MDNETLAKCRICLKAQGLEELSLQDTLPKSRITIADAVKKSFNIDVSSKVQIPKISNFFFINFYILIFSSHCTLTFLK
jgi:hypothetical protein